MTKETMIKVLEYKADHIKTKIKPQFFRDVAMALKERELTAHWEPKPRVGHWIYDKRIENWKCSECGCSPKTIGYVGHVEFMREHFKFCNHCGAKMTDAIMGEK